MNSAIDIIVPVYNVAKYLDKFFEALLNQTVKCFRIIAVYDVSEDNSLDILLEYQRKFSENRFLILYSKKRDGLGAARDFALNSGLICSKYVSFLDPDDFLEIDYYEKMLSCIEKTNSDICLCGFNRVDEKTGSILKVDMIDNPSIIKDPKSYYALPFFNTSVWNKLYRFELIKDFRFTNVKRSEDVCYFVLTFSKAKKICFVNEPLYNYLLRDSSLSASYSIIHVNQFLELVESTQEKLNEQDNQFFADVLFIRLAIGTVMRITSNNKEDGKKCAKLIRKFLLTHFRKFCRFCNIRFFNSIKKGKLVFFAFVLRKFYRFSSLYLIIARYTKVSKKKKKIISW